MLRVFKGIISYAEEGRLTGWIKTIVINSCIDFSKRKNIFNNAVSMIREEEVVIFPEVFDSLSGKDIQKLIAELPGATATVFNLYVYEGFTHKQIGDKLCISDSTSKWHVSEAKKILRAKLERSLKTELKVNAAG
jgi:RNA polymerase sigma factor (sigma-70 family)